METGSKINLGTVGILNRYKGLKTYLDLVAQFDNNKREKLQFSAVGHMQSDVELLRKSGIKMAENPNEALPEEEFSKMAKEPDYILLFYPTDHYKLIASGSLLATYRFQRPIIAFSTSYFRYMFEKYESMGYLVETVEEMAELIGKLDTLPHVDFNYAKALRELSPQVLAPRLKHILDDCRIRSHL